MQLTGQQLIGQQRVTGSDAALNAIDPATGERLEPAYAGGNEADVDRACDLLR